LEVWKEKRAEKVDTLANMTLETEIVPEPTPKKSVVIVEEETMDTESKTVQVEKKKKKGGALDSLIKEKKKGGALDSLIKEKKRSLRKRNVKSKERFQ